MPDRSDTPIVFPAPSPAEPAKGEECSRRMQARFPFTAAAEVWEMQSQTRITGRCSDLSAGGCYIDTLSPLAVGAAVKVRIEHGQRELEAGAVVAYAHVSMGMGLAFTEMKPEHQQVLRSWIAGLGGEEATVAPPEQGEPEAESSDTTANMRLVLNELIYLLVRKKLLNEDEASALLRRMFR